MSRPECMDMYGNTALFYAKNNVRKLIIKRLVLDAVIRRRKLQHKVVYIWHRLPGIGSPTSNQFFYDMGLALKTYYSFEELCEYIHYTTYENYTFYISGVHHRQYIV